MENLTLFELEKDQQMKKEGKKEKIVSVIEEDKMKDLYYNPQKMLSYNRIMNFVIGARGIGKTYSMKKYVINRFLKTGAQFIYLRMYKTDLKKVSQLFNDVQQEFPDTKLEVKGREFYINGQLAGWAIPISAWQSFKGGSYPNVETVVFDEFIREKDTVGYPPNVVESLLNICDTVIRNRDNFRCVCLSNSVSVVNPYFLYYNILPDTNRHINKYRHCVVEIPKSPGFKEERMKTRFGAMISELDYGRMSLDNEFTHDSDTFVLKRAKSSVHFCNIVYRGFTMGMWVDTKSDFMFLSQDYDPSSKKTFALTKEDMSENRVLINNYRNEYHLDKLVRAFKKGLLMFDNQIIRQTGYDMFKKMGVQ
ncbi:terminase [Bacillus phage DK3]|uniref:DNA encapsidation ATPase n=2 Tax=Hemphillvirus TaxID=2842725 RepID=A0A3T0IJ11_9CAUD|nr:terminase [Bacillus phage DK2]YP_009910530.1 terminase [Bacillus phage DK3]AZU99791.1 DNA encapsidation ATPase [Bacillus phage DK2]AZU99838.1 DNA encapsidation ATPase [Bacillus phage DK3]